MKKRPDVTCINAVGLFPLDLQNTSDENALLDMLQRFGLESAYVFLCQLFGAHSERVGELCIMR